MTPVSKLKVLFVDNVTVPLISAKSKPGNTNSRTAKHRLMRDIAARSETVIALPPTVLKSARRDSFPVREASS